MFKFQELVMQAIKKMANNEELTSFEQKAYNILKEQSLNLEKSRKKFNATHKYVGDYDMGDTKKNGQPSIVSIYRFTGWEHGKKYTGAKLRKMRRDNAKSGVKQFGDRLVDMWKLEDHKPQTELSRQQHRYMRRKTVDA